MENEQQRSMEIADDEESEDEEVPILVNVDEHNAGEESNDKEVLSKPITASEQESNGEVGDASSLPPVPVTILSGFLGSGKTTLIQYILRSPSHGKRIAVIENEFGGGSEGLSVESMIARDGANQESLTDLIELPNGCICCTVKDSLVATLENLLDQKRDLDYILIEASGMANPGPIASLFWLDDALESRLQLHGVVTLVDAFNIELQLKQTTEAVQQIAYADRILLNKIDLVDTETERGLVKRIRSIHPTAFIRSTTYSQVKDLDWILSTNCFDGKSNVNDMEMAALEVDKHDAMHEHHDACTEDSCKVCRQEHQFDPTHHHHTEAVGTIALVQEGSVRLKRMHAWLASLLWPNQDEANSVLKARIQQDNGTDSKRQEPHTPKSGDMQIFRIKGILSVKYEENEDVVDVLDNEANVVDETGLDARRFIVQAVFDLWEIHPASDDLRWINPLSNDKQQDEDVVERYCKLVVIGRCLQEKQLRDGFSSCFVEDEHSDAVAS